MAVTRLLKWLKGHIWSSIGSKEEVWAALKTLFNNLVDWWQHSSQVAEVLPSGEEGLNSPRIIMTAPCTCRRCRIGRRTFLFLSQTKFNLWFRGRIWHLKRNWWFYKSSSNLWETLALSRHQKIMFWRDWDRKLSRRCSRWVILATLQLKKSHIYLSLQRTEEPHSTQALRNSLFIWQAMGDLL